MPLTLKTVRVKQLSVMETNHALSPFLLRELVAEILSRLPIKTLLRFKCISKSWNSFISNPRFIKSHMQKSPKYDNIILILTIQHHPLDELEDLYAISCSKHSLLDNPSPFQDESYVLREPYRFVGSCNGLACCYKTQYDTDAQTLWLRFWNPATRLRSKKSPPLSSNWSFRVSSYSTVRVGFGYGDSSETFKAVALMTYLKITTVNVYTVGGDDCWRQISSFPALSYPSHPKQIEGQFVSGTLNWLAFRKSGPHHGDIFAKQLAIFSFDLEEETYTELFLPVAFDELLCNKPNLLVLWDCLCLFHCHNGVHLVVWQMKEFGVEKSWTQLINVDYQHLQIGNYRPGYQAFPLCTYRNGDVLIVLNTTGTEALLYNWKDNRVEERIEFPKSIVWIKANKYVQSLFLPC